MGWLYSTHYVVVTAAGF